MNRIITLSVLLIFGVATAIAQDPPTNTEDRVLPKQISGGVLNGKATSLPKPAYPPAARAVGAAGAVSVQVLIDENGDVVSASAVSGHPLLRAAAVEAARGAKFSPTQLMGNPVKVAGIITYNFVGPLYPARIGFVLSVAERSGSFGRFTQPESLAYQMPADWEQEKEILNSLTFEELPVIVRKVETVKPPVKTAETAEAPMDNNRYTIVGSADSARLPNYAARKLDAKSVSSLRNLMNLVESRSAASESSAWSYELGKAVGVLVAEIEEQSKLTSNVAKIETLADRAPATLIQSSLEQVREFVTFARTDNVTDDVRKEIVSRAEALANLRY